MGFTRIAYQAAGPPFLGLVAGGRARVVEDQRALYDRLLRGRRDDTESHVALMGKLPSVRAGIVDG